MPEHLLCARPFPVFPPVALMDLGEETRTELPPAEHVQCARPPKCFHPDGPLGEFMPPFHDDRAGSKGLTSRAEVGRWCSGGE